MPTAKSSNSTKGSAKKPAAAKAKTSNSPSPGKTMAKKTPVSAAAPSAAAEIDQQIAELGGWRGNALGRMRRLIHEADPDVVEEVKWRKPSNSMAGVPVWSHGGMICTGETYRTHVKLTFAKGAAVPDPAKLFNAGLDGGTRRAIDIHEGEQVDAGAFKALFRAAVALNASDVKAKSRGTKS